MVSATIHWEPATFAIFLRHLRSLPSNISNSIRFVVAWARTRATIARIESINIPFAARLLLRLSEGRVPVRTGRLLASGSASGSSVSYTAHYAVYVHENVGAYFSNGEAKFLEGAVYDNMGLLRNTVSPVYGDTADFDIVVELG